MRTSDFDYELPEELIAQHPPERRGDSRMLVLDPAAETMKIVPFHDFPDYFRAGDLIALNDTKVIKARLFAKKESGAKIEILLLSPVTGTRWNCLLKPAKRVAPDAVLRLFDPSLSDSGRQVRLVSKDLAGNCVIEFLEPDVERTLAECGHMPLPPYITRQLEDQSQYQTVYAKELGSAAAPTAGLHFTPELMDTIRAKGVGIAEVTLHVGLGTFRPVQEDEISDHKMHSEWYSISEETAQRIRDTKAAGHRVIAVGTTSCRTLEAVAAKYGEIRACSGNTSIFLYPGVKFNCIDGLVTNFHLPESTLIMLIAALYGYDKTMHAYKVAVEEKYRFFSFGDAMLIL